MTSGKKLPNAPCLTCSDGVNESEDNKLTMQRMCFEIDSKVEINNLSEVYMVDPSAEDSFKDAQKAIFSTNVNV